MLLAKYRRRLKKMKQKKKTEHQEANKSDEIVGNIQTIEHKWKQYYFSYYELLLKLENVLYYISSKLKLLFRHSASGIILWLRLAPRRIGNEKSIVSICSYNLQSTYCLEKFYFALEITFSIFDCLV